ncbi:hypothetical protein EON83_05220 [bacterium]|nr:MAG: hypothetical protein EON83_05220 [bacterium]
MSTPTPTDTPEKYSDWSEWNPKDYIAEYYSEVIPDCRFAMEWLLESLADVPPVDCALEFGTGPIPVFTFPLSLRAKEIHLADYLQVNVDELSKWANNAPDAQDWLHFSQEMLHLQGHPLAPEAQARAIEKATRARITNITLGDAKQTNPLGADKRGSYDLVTTHCCAESATSNKDEWRVFISNIFSLVAPGGTLIQTVVEGATYYRVGNRAFPAAGITRHDVIDCLVDNGFTDIDLRVRNTPGNSEQGFSSCVFARAVKGTAS